MNDDFRLSSYLPELAKRPKMASMLFPNKRHVKK
jgi:hypothetical protein